MKTTSETLNLRNVRIPYQRKPWTDFRQHVAQQYGARNTALELGAIVLEVPPHQTANKQYLLKQLAGPEKLQMRCVISNDKALSIATLLLSFGQPFVHRYMRQCKASAEKQGLSISFSARVVLRLPQGIRLLRIDSHLTNGTIVSIQASPNLHEVTVCLQGIAIQQAPCQFDMRMMYQYCSSNGISCPK